MLRVSLLVLALCACGSDPTTPPDLSVEASGGWPVGTKRFVITDAARSRDIPVQAWYPADASAVDTPIQQLEIDPNQAQYATLLASAPTCPTRTLPVALDGPVGAGSFPVVLISHCHSCTRLSNASTAIRLASHGIVALTIEHPGDTLWDHLAGHDADINAAELDIRQLDVRAVLDQLPASPIGAVADMTKVGMLGHSMGAVTAGRVAQLDTRITAAAALCAPMENPLIPGVTLADIHVPLMFMVAVEDNSITEFGNKFIRDNFTAATNTAYKIEVTDAGHWSVSDLDGLVDIFAPGCGAGTRQTDGSDFTYLEPTTGRNVAASYVTAFFKSTLLADAGARSYAEQASPDFKVTVDHH